MSVCPSVCPSVHFLRYRLNVFLSPLPEVRCLNFFRDFEFLGKSIKMKWSHIWKKFLIKGLNPHTKIVFWFWQSLPYWAGFFWYLCFSLRSTAFLNPFPKVHIPNWLDFWNPWGKIMKIKGLRFETFFS